MADYTTSANQPFDVSLKEGGSKCFDDDGRIKRTGTVWTASAHIITAVIGSGVLSLAWSTAQLGWLFGPAVMVVFSIVTYYTATLLAACYRNGDPQTGKRNYTYMEAVKDNLGGFQVKMCGTIQYINLIGVGIGYTVASAISMAAVRKSHCFHLRGKTADCKVPNDPYMIGFGVIQLFFSQIPDIDQISWLSVVAAVMSFTYSAIGLILGITKVVETGKIGGSLTGVSVGIISQSEKILNSLQALGAIAFAYSYAMILVEIEDTIKAPPPSEYQVMKKASLISVAVTTIFYLLCGCFGYAAFGNHAPDNLLTGFGFYDPFWLIDIGNIAIVVHLVGAYQVYSQPLFAFVEKKLADSFPENKFIRTEIEIPIFGFKPFKLSLLKLVWRTLYVFFTTVISMLLPFFTDVVGFLGALSFWPLTVYFPVEMYIAQQQIPKWGFKWNCLQLLSIICLIVSVSAAVGSVAGVIRDLKTYRPFHDF